MHPQPVLAPPRRSLARYPAPPAPSLALLHPLGSYALVDAPRFYAPPWGAAPAPSGAAHAATNGYDFSNDVGGDTYVFLLGDDLKGWQAAREAFVGLAGATPLLPDFAYGASRAPPPLRAAPPPSSPRTSRRLPV